jgi:transposase
MEVDPEMIGSSARRTTCTPFAAVGYTIFLYQASVAAGQRGRLVRKAGFAQTLAVVGQIAGLAGFTPTPYQSGDDSFDQGISKAGNASVRTMAIQIAWGWLLFQPDSALTLWYQRRYASRGLRMRKIGIVALARRLLIDLWRFSETGVLPEGAITSP